MNKQKEQCKDKQKELYKTFTRLFVCIEISHLIGIIAVSIGLSLLLTGEFISRVGIASFYILIGMSFITRFSFSSMEEMTQFAKKIGIKVNGGK